MKKVAYQDWVKRKGRVPTIIHFQPEGFVELETPEEQKAWHRHLAQQLGLDERTVSGFTWGTPTFSGDLDRNDRVGDDCEVDE